MTNTNDQRPVLVMLAPHYIDHLKGQNCKAGAMQPCGFSEGIMARVHDAVRRPVSSDPMADVSGAKRSLGILIDHYDAFEDDDSNNICKDLVAILDKLQPRR